MTDRFGRSFPYLRLSVTDMCNFSCSYCLPKGYQKKDQPVFLSRDEIRRGVEAFAGIGTWKVRLTGGEPTIRTDFLEIAKTVSDISGIRKLAMTTNGYRLADRAPEYLRAGIKAVNISIDSLDEETFHQMTGHNRLSEVIAGVHQAIKAGFEDVKINAVLMKGINDHNLDMFFDFIEGLPVSLRFIELMRTNDNVAHFQKYHVSSAIVKEQLLARGWKLSAREEGAGPALEYVHPDYNGSIGIIAPYAKDFCSSCNRLRLSAKGHLHLCLFGDKGYDLRPLLQSDNQKEELQDRIRSLLQFKKETHFLHDDNSGITPHLASIGG